MGHFASGVTVVASREANGNPVGLTVSAFASVSLEPLLILVCLHRDASGHAPLLSRGYFGVSILDRRQADLARRFAVAEGSERFRGVEYREGTFGSPLLVPALAWMECRVHQVYPGGDHSIILGEVLECGAADGDPLLFFKGELRGCGP
jgi:flavin reductase (DIM6/NTAB) family NADH-FMN oxidoreductase RutF